MYLASPFEGRPIASRGSKLAGFRRFHGPEVARPPRADIEGIGDGRGDLGWCCILPQVRVSE